MGEYSFVFNDRKKGTPMSKKIISVQIPEALSDKVLDISKEYSIDSEIIITAAIKKLLDDIEFIRELRTGKRDAL